MNQFLNTSDWAASGLKQGLGFGMCGFQSKREVERGNKIRSHNVREAAEEWKYRRAAEKEAGGKTTTQLRIGIEE